MLDNNAAYSLQAVNLISTLLIAAHWIFHVEYRSHVDHHPIDMQNPD